MVSAQMQAVLLLLEHEGPVDMRYINNRLYEPAARGNRRAFAASMSRAVRRMQKRGLIVREGQKIKVTDVGIYRVHPEQFEAMLEEIRAAVRRSFSKAWSQAGEQQMESGPEQNAI